MHYSPDQNPEVTSTFKPKYVKMRTGESRSGPCERSPQSSWITQFLCSAYLYWHSCSIRARLSQTEQHPHPCGTAG